MNYKFYVFGESSGYKQYPDDSIDFKSWYRSQQSNALLTIQRKQDLIYYIYTQAIDKDKKSFIGFCLVFNGVYIKNAKKSFELFEKLYSETIMSGKLFRINPNGVIGFATDSFASQTKEIERLNTLINDELIRYGRSFFATLPTSYRTGEGGQNFTMTDGVKVLAQAINVYDYITISNDNTNGDLDYVENMIQKLYTENVQIKKEYAQLNKKKKQYKAVATLFIIVVLCCIGLLFFYREVAGKTHYIQKLENEISIKRDSLLFQNNEISRLVNDLSSANNHLSFVKRELSSVKREVSSIKEELSEYKNKVGEHLPLVINYIELANYTANRGRVISDYGQRIYSNESRWIWFRVNYDGIVSGTKRLYYKIFDQSGQLKTFASSPSGYSYSSEIYVYGDNNSVVLFGWGADNSGTWRAGKYRIEIWYNDMCLKSKSFTIY